MPGPLHVASLLGRLLTTERTRYLPCWPALSERAVEESSTHCWAAPALLLPLSFRHALHRTPLPRPALRNTDSLNSLPPDPQCTLPTARYTPYSVTCKQPDPTQVNLYASG